MKYQTKQRDKIEQALFSRPEEHFTAEQLLALLEPRGVSRATLYRTLQKLLAEGRIRKYEAGEGVGACYQSAIAPACAKHYHLKCSGCGQLFHMECGMVRELEEHIKEEHNFRLDPARTVFYGLCQACQQKEKP